MKKVVKRKLSLILSLCFSTLAIFTSAVSTFAWFQANANINIETTSDSATITVSAPENVKFYYFKGNGVPGSSDYTGYSKSNATYGNKTNMVNTSSSPAKYKVGEDDYVNINSSAWGLIDKNDNVTTTSGVPSAKNCFNFSKMRPGCYYSFMIETNLETTSVQLSYDWTNNTSKGITGDNLTQKRYVNGQTNHPINILMAVNAYCAIQSTNDGSTFVKESLGEGSTLGLTDKITFGSGNVGISTSDPTTCNYTILPSSSNNTLTNKYIFFTIFMGKTDMSDAFSYVSTDGGINYYQSDSTNGNYSVFDGLMATLTTIVVA